MPGLLSSSKNEGLGAHLLVAPTVQHGGASKGSGFSHQQLPLRAPPFSSRSVSVEGGGYTQSLLVLGLGWGGGWTSPLI